MKKNLTLIITISLGLISLLTGCYTDTITKLQTVTIQFPIFVGYDRFTRVVPDTTIQFNNLFDFKEYKDNKSYIQSAEILDFNYRIDSLRYITTDGIEYTFDPSRNDVVYDSVSKQAIRYSSVPINFYFMRFYIHFAKGSTPSEWYPDPDLANSRFLLGSFTDTPEDPLTVDSLYRQAKNIVPIGAEVQKNISDAILKRPQFFIISEFSDGRRWDSTTSQWKPQHKFPYELIRFDLIIRLHLKL